MSRLSGFDYSRPFFYMVTLKRLKGLVDFSAIGPAGLEENAVTRAMRAAIVAFYRCWRCVDGDQPFIIMPDHLHLLIKIRDIEDRVHLGVVVQQLKKALREAYWRATNSGGQTPVGQDTGFLEQGAGFSGQDMGMASGVLHSPATAGRGGC